MVLYLRKGSGKQTSIDVDWFFGSEIKRRIVKICNIQLSDKKVDHLVNCVTHLQSNLNLEELKLRDGSLNLTSYVSKMTTVYRHMVQNGSNNKLYSQKPGLCHTLQGSVLERIRAPIVFTLMSTSCRRSQCIISNQFSH